MTRRRIFVQHARVKIRRSIEANQQSAPPPPRTAPARSARRQPARHALPTRTCPSCGNELVERHRLLGGDGSLYRRMTCTCGYCRVFKEAKPQ